MLQTDTTALPFPPGFYFDDVDDQVLDREDDLSTFGQAGAWGDYMAKMLTPDQPVARAA